MKIEVPYLNLKQTLLCLKLQVIDSLPFNEAFIDSSIKTPRELFNYLKPQLKYKNDPKGVEYLQTMQTLLGKNKGKGDCDCFTITTLSACYFLNFDPVYVVLVGKSKKAPTHIYTEVYDKETNKMVILDFTNPFFNMERKYNYKQRILFNI